MTTDIKEHIASEAIRIVTGARRNAYGKPEKNFERIATMWNAYISIRFGANADLNGIDVAAMMRLMKEARLAETPNHLDSFQDIVGYAMCGAEVAGVQLPMPYTETEGKQAVLLEQAGVRERGLVEQIQRMRSELTELRRASRGPNPPSTSRKKAKAPASRKSA